MFPARAGRRAARSSAVLALLMLASACTSAGRSDAGSDIVSQRLAAASTTAAALSTTVSTTAVSVPPITITAGASTPAPPAGSSPPPAATTRRSTAAVVRPPVATVSSSPAFGTKDISPVQPLVVSVVRGRITAFQLTNPEGRVVKGALTRGGATWQSGEVLGYGKVYTATGSALGTDGRTVPIKGSYATVEPDVRVRVIISPGDGVVVGVAAPVIVRFGMEPVDRAAVEKQLQITTTPKVEGAWAWIKHDDGSWAMDWRPRAYWPAGTRVHVAANVYGIKFGDGAYGGDDVTTDFTIGRSQIVYADARTHHIVVQRAGRTVADYPASYGSGDDIGDPNRVTRSGIHVVNELLPVHKMSNPAYGYVDVTEYWDVRISDNGEFIHQNQGTVGAQGSVNVSHGCINLSAVNARAYFSSALYGDPVEITGTSVALSDADGDLYDWTIPWRSWLKLSAL